MSLNMYLGEVQSQSAASKAALTYLFSVTRIFTI